MNLSQYRLNSWNELNRFIQQDKNRFLSYINQVYGFLFEMKPGEKIIIEEEVYPENRERFIKIACMFITENHPDYEFNIDYTILRRKMKHPIVESYEFKFRLYEKERRKRQLERKTRKNNFSSEPA